MEKLRISEDWKQIKTLFFVWPFMRNNLKEEYIQLINLISQTWKNGKITLIISKIENLEECISLLIKIGGIIDKIDTSKFYLNNNLLVESWITEVNDIWIRDWNFINTSKENNRELIKFFYDPSYGYNTAIDNSAGMKALSRYSSNNTIPKLIPFKLDGGNLISNGDYVLISNKLFSENYDFSKKEIESYFEKIFESKLITFDTDPLDIIGHSDSTVRFLDKETVILPIYNEEYKVENRYVNELYKILNKSLPIDTNYIFLPCG